MLSFVPLHQTALDRAPMLLPWLQSWAPATLLTPLTPTEWFERGRGLTGGSTNDEGLWIPSESTEKWFLWVPAPAAAASALQELCLSRQKRPYLGHIFVCPPPRYPEVEEALA